MNFAFMNESGCVVSAITDGAEIHIVSPACGGKLKGRRAEKLRKAFERIDDLEWTAEYTEAERNLLKHYELARIML